jgi:serine/threonine-protein kinase
LGQQPPGIPEPTEIAGRYQVVQKLGAGAFGTVYKAKDKILGRMVAIKTIRMEGLAAASAGVEEMVARFEREARVSAQLKHPNIVTIHDIGQSGGLSYLAMEFIDGVGLDRIISQSGKLPIERAASIGAQVAEGLDFAHKNGVVHRDIKPANIMIEAGDRVKITDFGIAKATDSGEHLTMTGSLLGTPSYMSPEQARGGTLDGRSDLFSVGCLLYEMVTGRKAFRGDSITALLFKIITEEPPPLKENDPGIPDEVERIILKALCKAPEVRYQSGAELAADLMASSARAAPRPCARSRCRRPSRRP